jgi:hypothetical protein
MDDIEYWNNEFETTKNFLGLCSPEVDHHVRTQLSIYLNNHPSFSPTIEKQRLWDQFIMSNPILQRVIYYTYSPAEAIEIRNNMLRAPNIDLAKDGWYIDFALNDPDFPDDALLRDFLDKMKFDMDRVTAADNWKREGAKESIEELRPRVFYGETREDDDGCKITKVVIDQAHAYKDEIIAKRHPDGTITEEYHTYMLGTDKPDTSRFVDETLIRWMQSFEYVEDLRESAYSGDDYVYVHNSAGKVIEKIPFGLEPKYRPLREKIHREYPLEREAYWLEKGGKTSRDQIDRRWDLEQEFRKAILNWDGKMPPPGYFNTVLKRGILNLEQSYRARFTHDSSSPDKIILKEDLDFSGGSLNDVIKDKDGNLAERSAFLDGEELDLNLGIDLKSLLSSIEHPADKLILFDYLEAKCYDDKPSSNAELSRQLATEGIKLTPQRIGKRRKKILSRLSEIFLK